LSSSSRTKGAPSARSIDTASFASRERHNLYETQTTPEQRQQQPTSRRTTPRQPDLDTVSTTSSHRTLRRTPRFTATPSPRPSPPTPRQVHLDAVSAGISPPPLTAAAASPESVSPEQPPQEHDRRRRRRRQLSQELSEEEAESSVAFSFRPQRAPSASGSTRGAPDVHPAVRVSRNTHSAILWTLEEAIRQPNPFTADLIEENASMAEMLGGGGPAVSNGNGTSSSRPTAPPTQTGSPSRAIRGPIAIMQERQNREARQRAEREQLEKSRAEQEARLLEEQNRQRSERERERERERRAAGAASIPSQAADPATTQRRQQRAEAQARTAIHTSQAPPVAAPAAPSSHQRPTRVPVPTSSQAPQGYSTAPPTSGPPPPAAPPGAQTGESSGAGGGRPRNSFPHAFERWEALSAHWEGLTSFWIRQLQQRSEEIDRDPVNQQLSRQVTDLSAAGANLFHAVVELQRLRASSERKFQRWFFETRGELERHAEVNAMLESALDEERRGRTDAIHDAVEHDRANSKTQKQLLEMRKELAISKEEARRAWEELGRREQEERERTISLQQGLPTIVGGVQVVPMAPGVPSRHGSTREPRNPAADAGPTDYARTPGGRPTVSAGPVQDPDAAYGGGGGVGGPYGGPGSEGGYSEGEYLIDAHGNFIRDVHGRKIPFRSTASPGGESDAAAEEYDAAATRPQQQQQQQQPGPSYPPSSSHYYPGGPAGPAGPPGPAGPADYAGQGYAAPGWETVPRHHHPTRLSDVIEEEDERSRTSASQVSRG